jgi:hypothetical protein
MDGGDTVASQAWLFCKHCYSDRVFAYVYKSHGIFGGGHEDWHCLTCGGCNYEPARKH